MLLYLVSFPGILLLFPWPLENVVQSIMEELYCGGRIRHISKMTAKYSGFSKRFDFPRIVINSHWEPLLPNAPGKDKLWKEVSPEAKRSGS